MNTKSKVIAAAAVAIMIISAPAHVLAQAAPGGGAGSGASNTGGGNDGGNGDAGTYGFGSAYHNVEIIDQSCDSLRKRAQWSDSHYWWQKYSRCISG